MGRELPSGNGGEDEVAIDPWTNEDAEEHIYDYNRYEQQEIVQVRD
jgi:hypothetical protein